MNRRTRGPERGVVVRVRHRRKVLLQLAASLRDGAAALEQDGAQLVNQRRPLTHQPIANPVQGLHIELLFTLQLEDRIVGRVAASAIASASRSSFFCTLT